jgi:Rieske Fe-S protein
MTDESKQDHCATRRCVLLGAGVVGAAGVLTACSTAPVPYDQGPSTNSGEEGAPATLAAGAPTPASTAPPKLLGAVADIPVGGGMTFSGPMVVVTQPTKGVFKAFSAVCTHVGCLCTPANGTINCPCHGSKFTIADGAVVPGSGPANEPLGAVPINMVGGNIFLVE